jgi:hypothetical protein
LLSVMKKIDFLRLENKSINKNDIEEP